MTIAVDKIRTGLVNLISGSQKKVTQEQEFQIWLKKQNHDDRTRRALGNKLADKGGTAATLIKEQYKIAQREKALWRTKLKQLFVEKFSDRRERGFELQHFIQDPTGPGEKDEDATLLAQKAVKYFPDSSRPGVTASITLPDFLALTSDEVNAVLTKKGTRNISDDWTADALLRLHSDLNAVLKTES